MQRDSERILVLRLRTSRRKARDAAVAEVLAVLRGLDARAASGGPLSEIPGVAWVVVPDANLSRATSRLSSLGYTESTDLVVSPADIDSRRGHELTRWKGRDVALVRIYEEL